MLSRCQASISRRTASSPRSRARRARSTPRARCANARRKVRKTGSRRSRWKRLARSMVHIGMWLAGTLLAVPCPADAQALPPYIVVGDAIPEPLMSARGNAARGRALVVERSSTCILCHSGPFPEQKFQGDLAPSLAGTGNRWLEGELRLRLVDASRLNAATIMPSYYRLDGLNRVGPAWRGKSILSAEQIEA